MGYDEMALAGAETNVVQQYPTEGTPTWRVDRKGQQASFIGVRRGGETAR
jgi:hypothetical protein